MTTRDKGSDSGLSDAITKWRLEFKRIADINTKENRPRLVPELSVFMCLTELDELATICTRVAASPQPAQDFMALAGDLSAALEALREIERGMPEKDGLTAAEYARRYLHTETVVAAPALTPEDLAHSEQESE
jgi:hypothetical protein